MRGTLNYIGPFSEYGVQNRFKLGPVMPVCPGFYQRQGNSRAVYRQMAFAPVLFPGRWGVSLPFPAPEARRSSSPQRLSRSSRCRLLHRIRQPGFPEDLEYPLFTPQLEIAVYGA
jgi:hypothetical protein